VKQTRYEWLRTPFEVVVLHRRCATLEFGFKLTMPGGDVLRLERDNTFPLVDTKQP